MLMWIAVLFSIYMGWSMGANDAANCVGTDIGSGIMKLRDGIIITCVFSFLGAVLLGSNVIKTIGKGVVPLNTLPVQQAVLISLFALLGASIWITIASYKKFPVSTSHSIVGAVAGGGLAFHTVIHWSKIGQIFMCWILTPFGSAILAMITFPLVKFFFSIPLIKKYNKQIIILSIYATSAYLAFSWGANDVANATGVLIGTGHFTPKIAATIGAVAITLGVTTWGYRVIETVGFNIIKLTPIMTIAIEIAASVNIHLYTHFGIPVSTSHSIIGAIWGVGILQNIKMINWKIARDIILAWALTPVIAGFITFLFIKILLLFL